jgi:hypothetical protein
VAIAGCAGAGKTMLAMEKARRLAAEGKQVLVTCFNVGLGNDLEARAATGVRAAHYHRLARELAAEAGLEVPDYGDTHSEGDYYRQTLPEAMGEAATILGPRWDAIIVDEAQDFLEEYWTSLLLHHRDPDDGILYAFFDDNQKLYTKGVYLPSGLGEPVLLPENCRSTRTIFEIVRSFYSSDHELASSHREGSPVEQIPAASEKPVIVLVLSEPGYRSRAPWDELMYVGTSRARSHLVLIGDEPTLAAIPGGTGAPQ